jgi:hypothetical protein
MDGDSDAQTVRPESDVGNGGLEITAGDAGSASTHVRIARFVADQFSSIAAYSAKCGIAVFACELAGLPRPAINLAGLARRAGVRAKNTGSARQRWNQALEQRHQPLAGHSDSGDDGESDEPGDQAVFNGGGGAFVAQEIP